MVLSLKTQQQAFLFISLSYPVALLLFGTLFLSALLTPLVYLLIELISGENIWPFSRVFHRVAMVVAICLVILLRKRFNIVKIKAYFAGLTSGGGMFLFFFGLLLSSVISFVTLYILLEIDQDSLMGSAALKWNSREFSAYILRFWQIFPAAILISVIEEGFFRVLLFWRMSQVFPVLWAATFSSALYSFVHFISPDRAFVSSDYGWLAGFYYLDAVAERLLLPGMFSAFFGLFLVGLILCYTMYKSRSFFLCLGLHSGWIIAIKLAGFATIVASEELIPKGAGRRYFLLTEPLGLLSLPLVFLIIFSLLRFSRYGRS
jgi:membrane protease YdiL (CAAX protease family)